MISFLIRVAAASFLTMREHSPGVHFSSHWQRWSELGVRFYTGVLSHHAHSLV